MASCFHDQQDFESDLKIEVARENDILEEGQEITDIECKKNPGHEDFIPFKDLEVQHLPREDDEMLNMIKKVGSRVVRLVVTKREKIQEAGTGLVVDKIKKKVGTGFVIKFKYKYLIKTNSHVVNCDEEVINCDVEFNYNSNISKSKGVELYATRPCRDFTWFTFDPVPEFIEQPDLMNIDEVYPTIFITYLNNTIVKEMTFGHFKSSKHIDCYKIVKKKTHIPKQSQYIYYTGTGKDVNYEQIDMMFLEWPDNSISYMKSRYFRFLPIPSNIQDLTNIKIHIDGNSRVISGDVVKLGGEYVIKISESIFQDEVEKCKIVWNGDEISFGTRLYFKYFKSREFFSNLSGVDFEDKKKEFPTNVWLFDFHPKPRHVVRLHERLKNETPINNWCCIGHPHGGIKMVTFGLELEESIERFDNLGRHIVQPGEDCQCKEVRCIKYSCKTCPGSSGSIIFSLNKIANISEDPVHFMSERVERDLPNGELIENINMAWFG